MTLNVALFPAVAPHVTTRPLRASALMLFSMISAPTFSTTMSTPRPPVRLARLFGEVVRCVVDAVVRAQFARLLELGVRAGAGDDARAVQLRHLDRRHADAATGGVHQHGLAVAQVRARQDHVQRRGEDERYRRRFFERQIGRLGEDVGCRYDDELRHPAVAPLPEQPVLRAQIVVAAEACLARAAAHAGMEHHLRAGCRRAHARADRSRRRPRRRRRGCAARRTSPWTAPSPPTPPGG